MATSTGTPSGTDTSSGNMHRSADRFVLRVITPLGLLFEEHVTSVTLPAIDGEIGVLPGHVGYNGILGTGLIRYEGTSSRGQSPSGSNDAAFAGHGQIVVSGGFCSFSDGTLTILGDQIDRPGQVDVAAASRLKAEAEKALQDPNLAGEARDVEVSKFRRAEAIEQMRA